LPGTSVATLIPAALVNKALSGTKKSWPWWGTVITVWQNMPGRNSPVGLGMRT
jgi:hypothetical protein